MADASGMTIIGIVVGSILGFMSLIGGIMYVADRIKRGTPIRELAIITGGRTLYYFIPYSLFLFGIAYDVLDLQVKYSPSGFIGLLAVFLNYITSSIFSGNSNIGAVPDVCGIPGMSQMGSSISPQNILYSTTVLSYITAANVTIDPTSLYNLIPGIALAVLFFVQLMMYYADGCQNYTWLANGFKGSLPLIFALLGGLLIGGSFGWGFTILLNPEKNPIKT